MRLIRVADEPAVQHRAIAAAMKVFAAILNSRIWEVCTLQGLNAEC